MLHHHTRIYTTLVLLATLFLYLPSGYSLTYPPKPKRTDYFSDQAYLIKPEQRTEINNISAALLKEEKIPLYVVTIKSLSDHEASGMSIENFAEKLFNEWGIGFKDRNYGILLLVSKGDRKARIELGEAWNNKNDIQSQDIMDNLIIRQFKNGNFSLGVLDGVRGLDAMARGLGLPKSTPPWWQLPLTIILFILFVLMIINLFKTGRSGWAWALIILFGTLLFFILRNAGSSSSGFGGGSSGGGGATGSW